MARRSRKPESMPREPDAMVVYDPVFLGWKAADPWTHVAGATPCYSPDYELLVAPLTVAVRGGLVSETGVFPKGVDLWLSSELRRAGFLTRRPGRG